MATSAAARWQSSWWKTLYERQGESMTSTSSRLQHRRKRLGTKSIRQHGESWQSTASRAKERRLGKWLAATTTVSTCSLAWIRGTFATWSLSATATPTERFASCSTSQTDQTTCSTPGTQATSKQRGATCSGVANACFPPSFDTFQLKRRNLSTLRFLFSTFIRTFAAQLANCWHEMPRWWNW